MWKESKSELVVLHLYVGEISFSSFSASRAAFAQSHGQIAVASERIRNFVKSCFRARIATSQREEVRSEKC